MGFLQMASCRFKRLIPCITSMSLLKVTVSLPLSPWLSSAKSLRKESQSTGIHCQAGQLSDLKVTVSIETRRSQSNHQREIVEWGQRNGITNVTTILCIFVRCKKLDRSNERNN